MHYEITTHGEDVDMRVLGTGDRSTGILASLQECKEGNCGCPTDQYKKLEAFDVHRGIDEVTVVLRALPGAQFDLDALAACLEHTIDQAHGD